MVRILISEGAFFDRIRFKGSSPFFQPVHSCWNQISDVCQILLNLGASTEKQDIAHGPIINPLKIVEKETQSDILTWGKPFCKILLFSFCISLLIFTRQFIYPSHFISCRD